MNIRNLYTVEGGFLLPISEGRECRVKIVRGENIDLRVESIP